MFHTVSDSDKYLSVRKALFSHPHLTYEKTEA